MDKERFRTGRVWQAGHAKACAHVSPFLVWYFHNSTQYAVAGGRVHPASLKLPVHVCELSDRKQFLVSYKMAPHPHKVELDLDRKEELLIAKQLRACRVNILPRVRFCFTCCSSYLMLLFPECWQLLSNKFSFPISISQNIGISKSATSAK